MKRIYYILSLCFIYPVSLLPFFLLYRVSDFLFVVLYYLVGYRRKVVQSNLRNSFPEKSEAELRRIEKRFYRHLSDLILEVVKSYNMSRHQVRKRIPIVNPELLEAHMPKAIT